MASSSSKPGSKIGRPRIEQESLRTGNDFRSDLLKKSRYSDCVSVSLQPCNVANLESLLRDKLAKAELKSKNFIETQKLRGLIGVWEELTATYICNDGKERIKSWLTFKEAFETFKGYDPQYHAETSGQYDDEYFQRALLHPQYGLCVIIATLVRGERLIILRSDDCDLHMLLDLLAKKLKPTQADIQLPLTAELLKTMLSSMDSEWDRKVARVLLGSNRSLSELHNLGMREGDISLWTEEVLNVCKEYENAMLAAEDIVALRLKEKLSKTDERIKNTEAKIKCKEGIWKPDMVDDLREQLEIDIERSQEYKALLEPVEEKKITNKLRQMRKRQAEQLLESNRLKRRRCGKNVGRPSMLDSDDETFVSKAIEEKATYHGRRHNPIMYTNKRVKVKDLVKIANHRLKQKGKKQIRSATTVWHRSAPRNKRSIQAKRHKFKGLFCTKKPPKTEDKDNENTHHQRAHVRNVQRTFWSQKTSSNRQFVFMQSIDDKAYVRPGTSEGFSKARNVKVLMPSDINKQRKLPKYDFAESSAFVTPSTHRILHKEGVIVDGSEKLVSTGDSHFVFTRPKAVIESSGTTWANETVLLAHDHQNELDVPGTNKGLDVNTRNFMRACHDTLFQYKDMFERNDLSNINTEDTDCRHKQYELDRLNHLQHNLSKASEQLTKIQSEPDLLVLSNRLVPLISQIQETIKRCVGLLNDVEASKHDIIVSCEGLALHCSDAIERIKDIGLPMIKPRWSELTDGGPGVSVTNFDVQIRAMEMCRMWNLDYYIRLHRSRGDSGQNEAERTNSAIGDALVDGGTLTWEYYPIFDGLTDEEIENLSVEAHHRNEEVRLEKNAWRVAEEIAERIDGAPVLGEFIHSQLTPKIEDSHFFNQKYIKEYQHATAIKKPSLPVYHYMQKLEAFMQRHIQLGEMYLEYIRDSCDPDTKCEYCQNLKWQAPIMERIPRPFPDETKDGHYLDVFNTPATNANGSPREIDDFLPRARVKKLFSLGELSSSDKETLKDLSKKLCVPVNLLQESVKHYEELKVLSEMRSRKRKENKIERNAQVYKDYDWPQLIKSGNLRKLTVKELEKYTEYHEIPCKYLSKDRKLDCIRRHYYAERQDEDPPLDSSASEEECSTDDSESDVGEDTVLNEIGSEEEGDDDKVLNEIGSEEEESDDEVIEDERMITATRSGRRILRRIDNDWLYY